MEESPTDATGFGTCHEKDYWLRRGILASGSVTPDPRNAKDPDGIEPVEPQIDFSIATIYVLVYPLIVSSHDNEIMPRSLSEKFTQTAGTGCFLSGNPPGLDDASY